MAGDEQRAVCPHCGGTGGPVGTPCAENVCRKQGYHFIPAEHASIAHGLSGPGVGTDPQIGRMVDRYLIVGTIGSGGMGSVYLALQLPLEREVALKMVSGVTLDEISQGRFEREAKAISMLYHPNIVQLYEYGFNPATGSPFMALEYVKGGRELVEEIVALRKRSEPWQPGRVERIFGQVLSALSTAHAKGLVHRDIKPQNIMLVDVEGSDDFVKILDFGLARTLGAVPGMDRLTGTGTVVGTPQYMAPEQLIGGGADVDSRSDLYGVGAILFEVATGLTAYPGMDPRAVLSLKLDPEYDPMERVPQGSLHEPLRTFLLRATAREPDVRFATATEMRDALLQALQGAPPMGTGLTHETTLEMHAPTSGPAAPDVVDAEAATVASDDLLRPRTEQLSTFVRHTVPSQETLETELEVPGKVPGRLVLAGTLTGVAILGLTLAFIFLVLPRLRTGPAEEPVVERSLADVGPPAPDTPTAREKAIGAAMAERPDLPASVDEEPGEETQEGSSSKHKHKTKTPAPEEPPAPPPVEPPPVEPPPVEPPVEPPPVEPPPVEPPPVEPEPLPAPPMKLIHAKLKALTPAVRQCLPSAQGQVTVGVVFSAATGKAGKVKVSGFYSGGDQAKSCIVKTVESLDVPPFSGSDVGVPYTYAFGPEGDAGISAEDLLKAAVQKKFEKAKGWLVACAGEKEGSLKVRVTVNGKTGKVKLAEVLNAPFAGSPEGDCMEKALEKVVAFPTFDKDEASFTHTYQIP